MNDDYKQWTISEMEKFIKDITPLRNFAINTRYLINDAIEILNKEILYRRN